MLAVLVGVTNIVPVLGPFLGAVPGIVILLLESPWKAAEFAIIILVVQQVDGNFIAPRILGGATGLPGLGVLLAIVVGGAWFGIPGMALGVPTLAVVAALLKQAVGAGWQPAAWMQMPSTGISRPWTHKINRLSLAMYARSAYNTTNMV